MEPVNVNTRKLRNLLQSGGLYIQAYFIRPETKTVRFIQCITQLAITILIYISSDYVLTSDNPSVTWEIGGIDLDSTPPAPEEIMEEYEENLETTIDALDTSENGLRHGYQVPVNLEQQPTEELIELRDIVNQLDRLKHSVAGIPYGLAVAYGSYLVYLDSSGDVIGYHIADFPHSTNTRRLYVVCDLETVYSKLAVLPSDTDKIYRSITGILTKNQRRLARGLANIIQNKGSALQLTQNINTRAKELSDNIQKFGELYRHAGEAVRNLESRISAISDSNVYEDISGSGERYHLNRDLTRAKTLRGKIADKLTDFRQQYEYLVLNTDKILFENILALERVLGNLRELEKISSHT
jgi:hypothetical protein